MRSVRCKQFLLWLAASALLGGMLYSMLVAGDYAVKRIHAIPTVAEKSEALRIEQEDRPQIAAAQARGARPMVLPSAYEAYASLRQLAATHGIAPLAPHPHTRLYACNEGYGLLVYTTDRFGFRNNDALWDQPTGIMLIGDSFTFGTCVEEPWTIAGQLSAKEAVLNLGTPGNHPLHYAALAKIFVPRIKPKTAVMIFCQNDNGEGDAKSIFHQQFFLRNVQYFDSAVAEPVATPGAALRLNPAVSRVYAGVNQFLLENQQAQPPTLLQDMVNWLRHLKPHLTLFHLRQQLARMPWFVRDMPAALPFSSALALDTLQRVCRLPDCKPLIVWIPSNPDRRPDARAFAYRKSLEQAAAAQGLQFYDSAPVLHALGRNKAYAIKGSHFSPEGYQAVASGIRQALAAR